MREDWARVELRLPRDLRDRLNAEARRRFISRNLLAIAALRELLDDLEADNPPGNTPRSDTP